ncbi:MAG: DUF4340 domain-containing protein [Betaproteobacteria bacterium]
MRGLKSTLALVVVLIGLGAYIYFVTWKQPADTTKQEKVFVSVQADKIDSVTVKAASGETTTLQKKGGAWTITAPIDAKADESEVSGITSNLASLDVVRVIDEKPANLKLYGLETPRIEITFKGEGDKSDHRLFIGDKSPTGADLFARRDDAKRVFLIPAFQESTFNRTTFDLRDKTLLTFDREKVDAVTVEAADAKPVEVAKSGSDWKLEKPVETKADYGAVEGLIGRLQTVQMKSIVTDKPSPADLKTYGLDKPQATVTLHLGSARAELLLGGKAPDNSVYARDSSRPMVMTVESALLDDLKKGPDALRNKDIFEFRAYNANKIEVTRNGQTIAFEKVKGQGKDAQDKWRRTSPAAKDVDKDTMDGFLTKLANMRAASFVDTTAKTGLDKPALAVHVTFDDGKKQERVSFGRNGTDVYASRPDEPGAAKIDSTDFDTAAKQLDELSK